MRWIAACVRRLTRAGRPRAVRPTAAPPDPAPPPPEGAAVEARPTAETVEPRSRALLEELLGIEEFAAIMRRHLGNVCEETERASMDIFRGLSDVERTAHALVQHVEATIASDDFVASGDRVRESIDAGRALIEELAVARARTGTELEGQLKVAQTLSNTMSDHIREIERIHRYTDVLSMNASIRVAALADAGGLDVVAQEIRGLAARTGQLATGLRTELSRMNDMLRNGIVDRLAAQIDRAEQLHGRFETLSDHIAVLDHLQTGLLDRVRAEVAAMSAPLMDLSGSIQFQDVSRQQLEQVGQGLSLVSGHIVRVVTAALAAGPLPETTLRACIDRIAGSYVMEKQREAHQTNACAAQSSPAPAAIELF